MCWRMETMHACPNLGGGLVPATVLHYEFVYAIRARAEKVTVIRRKTGGTPINDEVEEAIRMLNGLSDKVRSYLRLAQSKNEGSNPW